MEKSADSMSQSVPYDTAAVGYESSGNPDGEPCGGAPNEMVTVEDSLQSGDTLAAPLTLGPKSSTVVCPACHQTVQTEVKLKSTTKTRLFSLFFFVVGCCLSCFVAGCEDSFLDCCVDSRLARHHYCPSCKAFIGTYDK